MTLHSFRPLPPVALRFVILALPAVALSAAAARADDSGFSFLRLPVSARSAALGEAGVSFLGGASALDANPAGLADPSRAASSSAPWHSAAEAALTHNESFGNLRQDAVVVAAARGASAAALGFNTLYSESIEQRDEVGTVTGTFGLVSYAAQAGLARALAGGWSFGAAAGYVRERLASSTAHTWEAAAGAIWRVPALPGLALGAAVRHLGGTARFDLEGSPGESVRLPTTAQAGASYAGRVRGGVSWLVAAEARKARGDDVTGHAGAELRWSAISLRAGTRLGTDVGHVSAGLGLEAGRFRFDYAFLPSGEEIGASHRIELAARFGL